MTAEETISMHAARITRAATIMRTPYKPWERLKALEEVEASMFAAQRILTLMALSEREGHTYGPGVERNGRREME